MHSIKLRKAATGLTRNQASNLCRMSSRLTVRKQSCSDHRATWDECKWDVFIRTVGEQVLTSTGKELEKQLPRGCKGSPVKSIGHKVSAFYAKNNKVVTDRSIVVGSDEWLIEQGIRETIDQAYEQRLAA